MSDKSSDRSMEKALRNTRALRARLWDDPHRPRFHLLPPDGFFNDVNGTVYHKGRYHVVNTARKLITLPL